MQACLAEDPVAREPERTLIQTQEGSLPEAGSGPRGQNPYCCPRWTPCPDLLGAVAGRTGSHAGALSKRLAVAVSLGPQG